VPFFGVEIISSRVRNGSVTAAGESILSVCSGEITPDCDRQIRGLRISPPKPENFSKAGTEYPTFRGDLRHTTDARVIIMGC
jgi:hypothetical protein